MQPQPETVHIEMQQPNQIQLEQTELMIIPKTAAGTALFMACASFIICGPLLSIPALIMANKAKSITAKYPEHPDTSTAKWAFIVSIIAIIFIPVVLMAMIFADGNS